MTAIPSRAPVLALWVAISLSPALAFAWKPKIVQNDALVRQPGTQPNQAVVLEGSNSCVNCHAQFNPNTEPDFTWRGSMMAHSAHDVFFWAGLTVGAQDSIYYLGRPNATDECERCHLPKGWLENRSEPTNASSFVGFDFDGVQCDVCHKMTDPYFADTHAGLREGNDWLNYWDETNLDPNNPSSMAADACFTEDTAKSNAYKLFDGNQLYDGNGHFSNPGYTENASGQIFVSPSAQKRGPFADAAAPHGTFYSRYHKSKYICSTCHDVSNTHLANIADKDVDPNDGNTVLPSESSPAYSYFAVERTFSEFELSAYGLQGGAAGIGPFAPGSFSTQHNGNVIATCQDCHMPSVPGKACNQKKAKNRPMDSVEHPLSGDPLHDLTGGNAFVPALLASSVKGSPNYDAMNDQLLNQGTGALTLDFTQGSTLDPSTLLAARNRALVSLSRAASIGNLTYDPVTGAATFRIQNQTGHKLLTGYPEGRRMFVNVRVSKSKKLLGQVNPYDAGAGTLRGLPPAYSPNSPPLKAGETYADDLVYEAHASSSITGESQTFHFVLSDGMFKDNRIPPKGFRIAEAAARQAEPATNGAPDPAHFTAAEYAGGYDDVSVTAPIGGDELDVELFYQTVSREYVEFLHDEILGSGKTTLQSPTPSGEPNAYIVQSDPFFGSLKAWGDTILQVWQHNKDVPGAAPISMAKATFVVKNPCLGQPDGTSCEDGDACTNGDTCKGGVCNAGAAVSCDDQDKCTDDSCDKQLGCVHVYNQAPCDDGDPCTSGDVCSFGICIPGGPTDCSDGDPCTADSCNPMTGCKHDPVKGCGGGGGGGAGGMGGSGQGGMGGMAESSSSTGHGGAPATTTGSESGAPDDNGGCGCEIPGGGRDSGAGLLAMAGALLLSRRRRQR